MTEEPESIENQNTPDQQASEPEQVSPALEKGSISGLRETLTEEEAEKDQTPKKTGIFQKVTGILRLKTGSLQKTKKSTSSPLPPGKTALPIPAFTPDEIPTGTQDENLSPKPPFSEDLDEDLEVNPDETVGENKGEFATHSPESSIFDMLYQVRQSGLGELTTAPTVPETQPARPETPVDKPEITEPVNPKLESNTPDKEKNDLSDEIMTTSSLASRLWGLQEEPEQPKTEPDSSTGESEPDEAGSMADDQEEKRGFFDRFKGFRGEEKGTKSLEFDNDTFLNRVRKIDRRTS